MRDGVVIVPPRMTFRASTSHHRLLDVPHGLLATDRELEVFLGDRVPVLVDHHDRQQHADGEEEQSVDIVLDRITNVDREPEQHHLRDREKRSSEHNVSDWPSVVEGADDEDELRHHVNGRAQARPNKVYDPQSDRLLVGESDKTLEGCDGEEEANTEQEQARQAKELRDGCH